MQPRATKDLDVTSLGELSAVEAAVRVALAAPRAPWACRVELETDQATHMRRFSIRVAVREARFGQVVEQPFSKVQLEVSAYEGQRHQPEMVAAFSLQPFGLEGPDVLPCLPLSKQIAQKLHAVTEPPADGRTNDRFRDLLDVVILSALVPPSRELREVCEETFAVRGLHEWPPEVRRYPQWRAPMEQRATEMGLDIQVADEIVAHVTQYIRAIAVAPDSAPR